MTTNLFLSITPEDVSIILGLYIALSIIVTFILYQTILPRSSFREILRNLQLKRFKKDFFVLELRCKKLNYDRDDIANALAGNFSYFAFQKSDKNVLHKVLCITLKEAIRITPIKKYKGPVAGCFLVKPNIVFTCNIKQKTIYISKSLMIYGTYNPDSPTKYDILM